MRPGITFREARFRAEQEPCEYVAPQLSRKRRTPDAERICGAQPGETCVHPEDGTPLTHMPAHLVRLKAAGVAAEPHPSSAVS